MGVPTRVSTAGPRREGTFRVVLVLFGIVLGLLMLEGALRLRDWAQTQAEDGRRKLRAKVYRADPDLEWFPVPFGESIAISPGEFSVPFRMNSRGLNDREYPLAKPTDTTRILMLGDSFLQAVQVPMNHSMQALLEESLADRSHDERRPAVEVINGGVASYGPGHEYLLYQKMGRAYHADLVLMVLCIGNDVEDESPELAQRTFASGLMRNRFFRVENGRPVPVTLIPRDGISPGVSGAVRKAAFPVRLHGSLARLSKVYALVTSRLQGLQWIRARFASMGMGSPVVPLPPKYAKGTSLAPAYLEALPVVGAILREVKAEALEDGSRFGVVLVPELVQVHPDLLLRKYTGVTDPRLGCDLEKPNRALRELLDAGDIPTLDLLPVFLEAARESDEKLYFMRDGHLSPAGHRVAARAVEEWLLENGLLGGELEE